MTDNTYTSTRALERARELLREAKDFIPMTDSLYYDINTLVIRITNRLDSRKLEEDEAGLANQANQGTT